MSRGPRRDEARRRPHDLNAEAAQMAQAGIEVRLSTPQAFGQLIRADLAKWAEVVKASGAKVD